jgi:hypothetical protein
MFEAHALTRIGRGEGATVIADTAARTIDYLLALALAERREVPFRWMEVGRPTPRQ